MRIASKVSWHQAILILIELLINILMFDDFIVYYEHKVNNTDEKFWRVQNHVPILGINCDSADKIIF